MDEIICIFRKHSSDSCKKKIDQSPVCDTLVTGRFLKSSKAGKEGHIPLNAIIKSVVLPAGSLYCACWDNMPYVPYGKQYVRKAVDWYLTVMDRLREESFLPESIHHCLICYQYGYASLC